MRLKPTVSIYKIGERWFARDGEQMYSLDSVSSEDALRAYIAALERGAGPDAAGLPFTPEQTVEFGELVSFLKQRQLTLDAAPLPPYAQAGLDRRPEISVVRLAGGSSALQASLGAALCAAGWPERAPSAAFAIFTRDCAISEEAVIEFNAAQLRSGLPWLYVDMSLGTYAAIGPLIIPGQTACYECFVKRKLLNGDAATGHAAARREILRAGALTCAPWQYALVSSFIMHELAAYRSGLTPAVLGGILYADFATLDTWTEGLLRYPRCPVCASYASHTAKK